MLLCSKLCQQNVPKPKLHEDVLGLFPSFPAASCAALPPSSLSSYYWVSTFNDSSTLVYCTTANIEMRVCRSTDDSDEDIAIEIIEIYVQ